MIESVGYTDDGMVFVILGMSINGEKLTGNLMMTPEAAVSLSKDLVTAAEKVEKKRTPNNVKNSANLN